MIDFYLNGFTQVIRETINPAYLNNFENNLSTLKVKQKHLIPNMFSNTVVCGEYDSKKNRITLYDLDEDIIIHELLHMASSKCVNKNSYEGFYCDYFGDRYILFGVGINEGYTEALARRLFDIKSNVCNGYEYLVYVVTLLEKIVGREKMEECYFKADLDGLLVELNNYNTPINIIRFIDNCDYIIRSIDKKIILFRKDNVFNKLVEINKFLATSFAKKMYLLYKDNLISRDDMIKEMFSFNGLLIDEEEEPDKYRSITSKDDIYSYLEDSVGYLDKNLVNDYKLIRKK